MAIAWRVTGAVAKGTTGLSVVIPSTAVVGDMLVLSVESTHGTLAAVASATGWAQRDTLSKLSGGVPYPTMTILWRACVAGDPGATVVLTFSNAPTLTMGVINAYPGADTSTPFEASTIRFETVSGATHATGTVVTTRSTDWILCAFGTRSNATWTAPTGYVERSDNTTAATTNIATVDSNGAVAAGTIGPLTATASAASQQVIMWIGALQEPTSVTSTETGGGVGSGVASGPEAVTPAATVVKTGGGVAAGAGSGPKVITSAAVYSKTGGSVAPGVGSGPKAITFAAVVVKTGGGVGAGVASGPKTVVTTLYVKTGGAVAAGATSGPKALTVHTVVVKTGAAVAATVGSGPKALAGAATSVKTGGAVAAGVAVGSRVITAASVWAGAASAAAGVWSNVAGAVGSTAGDYASWTASGTPGDTATLDLSGFGAGSVPPGAVVSSVDVTVRHRESDVSAMATVQAQLFIGATPVGVVATLTKRVVDGDDVFTITGAITYADLANLHVRLIATGT